jgi:hypothetical protein
MFFGGGYGSRVLPWGLIFLVWAMKPTTTGKTTMITPTQLSFDFSAPAPTSPTTPRPAPAFDVLAAVERLAALWRMDCGASNAAFCALQIALTAQGSISADDLWRLDVKNRAAALGLLAYALPNGYDAVPAPAGLRDAIYAEKDRRRESV